MCSSSAPKACNSEALFLSDVTAINKTVLSVSFHREVDSIGVKSCAVRQSSKKGRSQAGKEHFTGGRIFLTALKT